MSNDGPTGCWSTRVVGLAKMKENDARAFSVASVGSQDLVCRVSQSEYDLYSGPYNGNFCTGDFYH